MGGTSGVYMSDTLIDNYDAIEQAERDKTLRDAEQEFLAERDRELKKQKTTLQERLKELGNKYRESRNIKTLLHIRKVVTDLKRIGRVA